MTVRDGDKVATAQATLHVSNAPPVVFEDGEFQPGVWTVTAVGPAASSPALQGAERMASGGNPGAYLRTQFGKPAGAGSTFVFYLSPRTVYDPAAQGAIYAVEAMMDSLPLSPALPWGQRELWLLAEQGGRRYGTPAGSFPDSQAGWVSAARAEPRVYNLAAIPFSLGDGTTCGAPAWPCSPDFSATAAPLRFGFAYYLNVDDAFAVSSGIDNWRVTVFRR